MATQHAASPEWSQENVRRQLESAQGADGAAAQVFFDDQVAADQLVAARGRAMREAQARLGVAAEVKVGRISVLAKSVSVQGSPQILAELLNSADVCAVLPCEVADIYPKPGDPHPVG